jgi:hypothetical protein
MIISLEGPSFAGKSSLSNALIKSNQRLTLIPEYNIIAGGAKNFPSV